AGGVLPSGPANRKRTRQLAGKMDSWLTGDKESPVLLIEDGFQPQPCFQPAPLHRRPRNAEKGGGFALLQPLVPDHVKDLAFLLGQGRRLLVELGPDFQPAGLVRGVGRIGRPWKSAARRGRSARLIVPGQI